MSTIEPMILLGVDFRHTRFCVGCSWILSAANGIAVMTPKITVLIPCKDEQDAIRDCIDSVRMIADEILVADSGSTDQTMAIVNRIGGCRLIQREFVDYSDFKNWAIPQAAHEWVLILDADERLTPELSAEILNTLENPSDEVDAYWIYRRTFFLGRELRFSGVSRDKVCRLIRRDRCRYRDCRVHEEIEIDKSRTRRLQERMIHLTIDSYDDYFDKQVRYTKWRAQDRWDDGKRTRGAKIFWTPVLRFLLLYLVRQGFRDGLVGLQFCMLQSFFVSFVKQCRLWEMENHPSLAVAEDVQMETPNRLGWAVDETPERTRRSA